MPAPGYVYVLFNPALKGLVKIGRTARDPRDRALELSAATGVPTSFEVVYDAYFADAAEVETFIHSMLADQGYRLAANREFFQMPVRHAVKAVVAAEAMFPTATPTDGGERVESTPHSGFDEICDFADALYSGAGDVLQDQPRAIELYRKVAAAGSGRAVLSLSTIWMLDQSIVQWDEIAPGLERAMNTSVVEASGYFAIGMIRANHEANTRKCWDRLFNGFGTMSDHARFNWGLRYVFFTPLGDVQPNHAEALQPYRDRILGNWDKAAQELITKTEFALFPEKDTAHTVERGLVGEIANGRVMIFNSGDSYYGDLREVKLGEVLQVRQEVEFIPIFRSRPKANSAIGISSI